MAGESTASLGDLCQCLATLMTQTFVSDVPVPPKGDIPKHKEQYSYSFEKQRFKHSQGISQKGKTRLRWDMVPLQPLRLRCPLAALRLPALELFGCRHLHHPCGTAHQLTPGKGQHDSFHPTCASLPQGTWEMRDKACMPPSTDWSWVWIPQAGTPVTAEW